MTQRDLILSLLKENGNKGLNSYDADYLYHAKQAATRVFELKQLGYLIAARHNPDKSVNWILVSSIKLPDQPKAPEFYFKNGTAYLIEEPKQMSFTQH